jgi:hypothetical protein
MCVVIVLVVLVVMVEVGVMVNDERSKICCVSRRFTDNASVVTKWICGGGADDKTRQKPCWVICGAAGQHSSNDFSSMSAGTDDAEW